MAGKILQQLDTCAAKIRERACSGCQLIEVAADIDAVSGQLRWEFDELLTA